MLCWLSSRFLSFLTCSFSDCRYLAIRSFSGLFSLSSFSFLAFLLRQLGRLLVALVLRRCCDLKPDGFADEIDRVSVGPSTTTP